jgi:hypothetical protein
MTRELDKATPTRLGEYEILRALPAGQSFLAVDGAGRQVVLKRLATDCLLGTGLHPHVRDRLSRVRELAHPGVANLIGVEATAMGAMLVWEFVAGRTLEEMVGELASARDLSKVAEEVLLSVQALHGLGIVHGAVHGRNIIVDERGAVILTHISPLLYDDPRQDAQDVAATMLAIAKGRGWDTTVWERLTADAQGRGLAGMRARLTAGDERATAPRPAESRRRWQLVAGGLGTIGIGLAVAGGVIAHGIRARPAVPVPPRVAPRADQGASQGSTDSQAVDNSDVPVGQ